MTTRPDVSMNRTAVILLASGLSKRFGHNDKMLEDLGGKPLVEHAAGVIAGLDALARVAVCPADGKEIGERLIGRFVIAMNEKPKEGLGHSIALGVQAALQFKPDAIVLAMGDMPFIEEWVLLKLVAGLGPRSADIVHSGGSDGIRPPTAFSPACFLSLSRLAGDDGARQVIKRGSFGIASIQVPASLLADVDTKEDIELARRQLQIRQQHAQPPSGPATLEPPAGAAVSPSP